uniref:Uncharacterized protein n=1 Tax=Lepeophtheirus salmonis TaxID=72036 RepID=A0A0K2VEU4_LEPSM
MILTSDVVTSMLKNRSIPSDLLRNHSILLKELRKSINRQNNGLRDILKNRECYHLAFYI